MTSIPADDKNATTAQIEDTAGAAAEAAKSATDTAAAWAAHAVPSDALKERAASLAETGRQAIDSAAESAKAAKEAGWEVAQKARAQAADIASDVYDRGQRVGAEIIRQTQAQPLPAILTAMGAGVLLGFALAFAIRRG
jgi:hypothetical protein